MFDFRIDGFFEEHEGYFLLYLLREVVGTAWFDGFFDVRSEEIFGDFVGWGFEESVDIGDELKEEVSLFVEHEFFDGNKSETDGWDDSFVVGDK